MSCLNISEQGAKVSVSGGRFVIECPNGMLREIPEKIVESIMVFGNVHVTYGAQKRILEKGISTSFLSTRGHYFGRLHSTSNQSAERVKKQVYMSDDLTQRHIFAKSTLRAKINNQIVLLRRYARNQAEINLRDEISHMQNCEKKIEQTHEIDAMMGYEGTAARYYFQGLSKLVDEDFKFSGRSKRPPKDAFNSFLVRKLEAKMSSQMNYLEYLDHPTSFRRGIWWQVRMLASGIDKGDISVYKPIRIR